MHKNHNFDSKSDSMKNALDYITQNKDRFINELIDLLKIPSISADPAYKKEVFNTADAVASKLREAGCDSVEICETPGYPIVYGEGDILYDFSDNQNHGTIYGASWIGDDADD